MSRKPKLSEQDIKFISRMRKHPDKFIQEVLGVKHLTDEQRSIVLSVWANKYTGVKAAHSVGKTFIEACIVLTYMNLYSNAIVITTAPTARQVRTFSGRK